VKTQAVEQYIKTVWDRTGDGDLIRPETDTEVAEKLGVSRPVVNRVVNNVDVNIIYHDRVKAREYYEDNPAAGDPVTAWTRRRLHREHAQAVAYDADDGSLAAEYPPDARTAATAGVALLAWALVAGVVMVSEGMFYVADGQIGMSLGTQIGTALAMVVAAVRAPDLD
jgi:hypothetical protein